MSSLGLDAVLERGRKVAWQTVAGEMVLVRSAHQEVLSLNEVGGRVWALADGSRNVGQIAEIVGAEFDVTEEDARADLLAFLSELVGLQILSVRAA